MSSDYGKKAAESSNNITTHWPAPQARQYYPVIRRWFERLEQKKGCPIGPHTLLTKEIARGTYHVLLKDEPFHGKWKTQPLEHHKQRHWPQLASRTP